jgi:hypothetical protein
MVGVGGGTGVRECTGAARVVLTKICGTRGAERGARAAVIVCGGGVVMTSGAWNDLPPWREPEIPVATSLNGKKGSNFFFASQPATFARGHGGKWSYVPTR